MALNNFDLHNIMMYYCEDEYTIIGDAPYKLKMVEMLTGKRPTAKQLNDWASHFKEWALKKQKVDTLLKRDDEIDILYLKAQRRNDNIALKKLEMESQEIDSEIAKLNIKLNPLEDYKHKKGG